MKIIDFENKYKKDIAKLLVEEEKYIITIDKDNLDVLSPDFIDKYAANLIDTVNNNEGKIFLIEEDSKIIGMIAGKIVKHSEKEKLKAKNVRIGEIDEIMITKPYQRKGYGTILIHKIEAYFKKIGCDSVILGVFAYNESAIAFYEKQGYHIRTTTKIKKI